jgi:hypothetical protein
MRCDGARARGGVGWSGGCGRYWRVPGGLVGFLIGTAARGGMGRRVNEAWPGKGPAVCCGLMFGSSGACGWGRPAGVAAGGGSWAVAGRPLRSGSFLSASHLSAGRIDIPYEGEMARC